MGRIRTLAFALSICVALNSLGANERVIRGQIHGIDSTEGAWVGIVTGKASFASNSVVPHDEFMFGDGEEKARNWTFVPTNEFELKSEIEEEAVLLVVSKNRVQAEIAIHPDDVENPIEVSLTSGVGIKGFVRASDGKPVVGAEISFSPSHKQYDIPLFAKPKWVTNFDGSFHLEGLEGEQHYVMGVTAEGFAPVILGGMRIPEQGINHLEIELQKGYFVSGFVVGEDGETLADIEVRASWTRNHFEIIESDGIRRTNPRPNSFNILKTGTRTEPDGSFWIGPFANGTTGKLYAEESSIGSAISREISVPYSDLVLRLDQEVLRGRVLDETSGAPIERFSVAMYIGESRSHAIESSEGVFDIPVYPFDEDGTEIRVSAQGYLRWTREVFGGSSGEYDLGDISLVKARAVRGIVRNAQTGSPIKGVAIFLVSDRGQDPYNEEPINNWSYHGLAYSDPSGAFTLDGVDHRVDRLFLIIGRTNFASVDLPKDAEEFNIDLQLNGVIDGSLILPDRTPVKGVLEIRGSSWMMPWKTEVDGSFRLERLVPDTYTLSVETDAGLVEQRSVVLKANERLSEFDLIVEPGWTVTGTISGLEGIERVKITAQDLDSNVLVRKRFLNGEYAIHGLPQEVTLVARSSSGHTLVREFRDGNEKGSVVDFHINGESQLTGWLTSGGEPLSGIAVAIKPEDPEAITANVMTTESGRYEALRLTDGKYVISTDTGYEYSVEINGDTMFDIEVPQNSLSGIVKGERTRLPIGGGQVKLVRANDYENERSVEITRRIGGDGTFLFKGLVRGDYDILVEHPNAETISSRMHVSGFETVEMRVNCANTLECVYGRSDEEFSNIRH